MRINLLFRTKSFSIKHLGYSIYVFKLISFWNEPFVEAAQRTAINLKVGAYTDTACCLGKIFSLNFALRLPVWLIALYVEIIKSLPGFNDAQWFSTAEDLFSEHNRWQSIITVSDLSLWNVKGFTWNSYCVRDIKTDILHHIHKELNAISVF